VKVAKRYVVQVVEEVYIDGVCTADTEWPLGFTDGSALDKGVPDQHGPSTVGQGADLVHHSRPCCLLIANVVSTGDASDPRRLEERNGKDRDFTMVIAQDHRGDLGGHLAHDVQLTTLEQSGTKPESIGTVVVAWDQDDRGVQLSCDPHDQIIEEVHRFGGRNRSIVDITGDEQCGGLALLHEFNQLLEDDALVFEQALAVQLAPQVEVGGVNKGGHRFEL